jgi:putative ABC transport system substrate-binding protein
MVVTSTLTRLAAAAPLLLLAWSSAAQAQQATRVYRIGFVATVSPNPATEAFRQGLREAGYVEGKNVIIDARFAEGRQERLPERVAEVLRLKVDVLVCGSTVTVLAAKKATTTVPIVFASVFDPVASGIVTNLARPGGNITGATIGVGGLGSAGKWVELLKEAVPGVSHVAVPWNSVNPASAQSVREIQAAARDLNVKLDVLDTGNAAALDRAFATIGARRAQGIIVTNDPFFTANRAKLVQFAASTRLPAVYFFKIFADAGGEACRPSRRAIDALRAGHQLASSQGAWAYDSAIAAASS